MATSSKDSGYVDNWQTRKTVTECNLHMLTSEDYSDVTFRVGSEKQVVRAHRYVLVSRSCVFQAMFCGPLAEKGEVTIPDIEPTMFREFLRYLYTDTATLTADNVTGLLYTSRKYAVDALQDRCVTFLEKSLSEHNVCQILEHCHGYGETDFEQKALKILIEAGAKVIKSPGFLELCSDCLEKFLKSEILNLKEEEIFECVLSWGKAACNKEGIISSTENLKKVLGQMRYEIRFTELPLKYLADVVGPSGFLDTNERVKIMDTVLLVGRNVDISPFKAGPRKMKPVCIPRAQRESPAYYVRRYSAVYATSLKNLENQAVAFTVSKNTSLLGCQLYGPRHKAESIYLMSIFLYDDQDQVIAKPLHNTTRKLRGKQKFKCNDVMFPDPVALVAGRTYTICVTMSGDDTYCGYREQSAVTVDGMTVTFSDSQHSTYTCVGYGQIPGLIVQFLY